VVVVNAGVTKDGLALRMSDEQWREVLSTDLDGAFYTASSPRFDGARSSGFDHLHWIDQPVHRVPGQANYAAAKADS